MIAHPAACGHLTSTPCLAVKALDGLCTCGMQGSRHAQILQEEALRQVDLRRRMRATVVPTGDADVRRVLRQLGEPVTLFGEQQARADGALAP